MTAFSRRGLRSFGSGIFSVFLSDMSYTINSRNRRFKQRLATTFNRLSFHFFHLSSPKKIVFIGAAFSIVGLFVPWFSMATGTVVSSYNAFSILAGYIGYVISVCVIILFFLLLSNKNKQAVKSRMGL
jgi:UDP-N-acetylmuramyl pentapeptide phosphotransferase/UDP-N-acetylglucosamine-1-phosphate transferase